MFQPYLSSGQPVEPPPPPVPAPVRTAVKLMYAGAVVSTVPLIIALAYSGDIKAYHLTVLDHTLTTAQLIQWRPLILAVAIVVGLAAPALWLWIARATGQGRNWARILAAVLAGLAALQLAGNMRNGAALAVIAVLTWLTGLAAAWLLWRPASSPFFRRRQQAALPRQP
jgi:hypothetical protein